MTVVATVVLVIRETWVFIMTFANATIMVFITRLVFAMAGRALLRAVVWLSGLKSELLKHGDYIRARRFRAARSDDSLARKYPGVVLA